MPVSLTFDDGPEPRWTAAVLDALGAAGARATFFVLAAKAARAAGRSSPGRSPRATRCSCTATATCATPSTTARRSSRTPTRPLRRLDLLGVRPTLWRLPWGRAASWTPAIARERGLRIVGWDADTHDWRGDSAAAMLAAVAGDAARRLRRARP